jgi:HlyD family secretion protein
MQRAISQLANIVTPFITVKYLIAALVILGLGGFWFIRSGSSEPVKTLVVEPMPFTHQVTVSGRVKASEEIDLGFPQGGRVAHVYTDVGRTVSRGALLAELDNADIRAQAAQREAALESQRAKLAQLKEGPRPEKIAVAQSAVDAQGAAVARANDAVVDSIRDAYAKSDAAVRTTVDQFVDAPRSSSPTLKLDTSSDASEQNVVSRRSAIEGTLSSWSMESIALTSADDLDLAASHARAHLIETSQLLAASADMLARGVPSALATQSTIDGYASSVAASRTSVNAATSALSSALTARESAKSALNAAQKSLALEQLGATQSEIDAQSALVRAAEADLNAAYAALTKTRIVAPFSGTVTTMDAKVGESVSGNTPEISLISTGTFEIESFVPEINVAAIAVNNEASVTLDAYGEEVLFAASVASIDPAETIQDGVSTYRTLLKFSKADPRIKTGMTATVTITTQNRENVLSIPLGSVVKREGSSYVTVVMPNGTETERVVTLGDVSSEGNAEILSGLTAGDVIVLDPAE